MRATLNSERVLAQYKDAGSLNARWALHRDFSVNPVILDDWLFEQIEFYENTRALDIGCGDARLWGRCLSRVPSGARVTLADLSEGMLEAAEKRLDGAEAFEYVCCDAQSLPFDTESFDTVMAMHMLYHVPDIDTAVSEVRRVLYPGGKFYASTNSESSMSELAEIIAGFDKSVEFSSGMVISAFSMESGGEILSRSFKNVERRDYEDALRVTAARPLMDYYFSMSSFVDKDSIKGREDEFEAYLNGIIEKKGFIHIGKRAGVFIAS